MTLPYYEDIVNDEAINYESFKYPNFVGYLNPYGIPISFRDKFGYTGHGQSLSIQERFRVYYTLKMKPSELISPFEEYIMTNEYQHSEKERHFNSLKNLRRSFNEDLKRWKKQKYPSSFINKRQMELDIYDFFINCYRADTFFDGIGNVETCLCEREFWLTEYKDKDVYPIDDYHFKMAYQIYKDKILAEAFKNVLIQYLGYHAVERVPKTITTSSFGIYQKFYYYLKNDFTIYQIPKMFWNPKERTYISFKLDDFFLPDSEIRLKEEIKSQKKFLGISL